MAAPKSEKEKAPAIELHFSRPGERVRHIYGPFTLVEDVAATRNDTGGRELWATHTRGRELFATSAPSGRGWTIVIEPIRGTFDVACVAIDANA